jgi:hypothetical protein
MLVTAQLVNERRMAAERASQQAFFGVSALLFAASAAVAIVWCESMSAMGEMPMPGGWAMSMAWMRMPGQTWPRRASHRGRRRRGRVVSDRASSRARMTHPHRAASYLNFAHRTRMGPYQNLCPRREAYSRSR